MKTNHSLLVIAYLLSAFSAVAKDHLSAPDTKSCTLKIKGSLSNFEQAQKIAKEKGYDLVTGFFTPSTFKLKRLRIKVCVQTFGEMVNANNEEKLQEDPHLGQYGYDYVNTSMIDPGACVKWGHDRSSVNLTHLPSGVSRTVMGVIGIQTYQEISPSNQAILEIQTRALAATTVSEHDHLLEEFEEKMKSYDSSLDHQTNDTFYEEALKRVPTCAEMYGNVK